MSKFMMAATAALFFSFNAQAASLELAWSCENTTENWSVQLYTAADGRGKVRMSIYDGRSFSFRVGRPELENDVLSYRYSRQVYFRDYCLPPYFDICYPTFRERAGFLKLNLLNPAESKLVTTYGQEVNLSCTNDL